MCDLDGQQVVHVCRDEWEEGGYQGGIIHGGRGKLLGVQLLGAITVLAWVTLTIGPTFLLLRYFDLFRVPTEVQISVHVRSPLCAIAIGCAFDSSRAHTMLQGCAAVSCTCALSLPRCAVRF